MIKGQRKQYKMKITWEYLTMCMTERSEKLFESLDYVYDDMNGF